MLWSFKDSIRSKSQKDKLIFWIQWMNHLELLKTAKSLFYQTLKKESRKNWKHFLFRIICFGRCLRRLDSCLKVSGQSWNLSIYLCRDWNNYYRIGYSPPGHPLSTNKKGEKYMWDKILSRRLSKMLNKVAPFIMMPGTWQVQGQDPLDWDHGVWNVITEAVT